MPLPERRKTPEELAKLRESLGIPAEGLPDDAPAAEGRDLEQERIPDEARKGAGEGRVPGVQERVDDGIGPADPIVAATVTPPEGLQEVLPGEKARMEVHSLRKSAGLVVDQPKPHRHREDGSLPVRRHSDEELMRMRRLDSGPAISPVEVLARQKLSLPLVILLYLFALAGVSLLLMESLWISRAQPLDLPFDWLRSAVLADGYRSAAAGLVGGVNFLVLLAAGGIAWRRPLSRHHAGFLALIAGLVLVFATLYFFPELHAA